MRHVAIVPQQVVVAAPAALVFEMLSTLDYAARPNSGRGTSVLGNECQKLVVAFTNGSENRHATIVKEMIVYAPDRITYRHVSGSLTGATEELQLASVTSGTELRLSAEFDIDNESGYRLLKMALEHDVHEHLLDVKAAAEGRTRPLSANGSAVDMLVPIPMLSSEQELLDAIEGQEEAEWGHAGHGRGVARVAVSLAEAILLPARQVDQIRRAALLHDMGKIAIDSALWGMRGVLTHEQRALMEAHPRLGADICRRASIPEAMLPAILHHHERWDGMGYPEGLAGDAIPLRARILFVAEAVDSMLRATYRRQPLRVDAVAAALEQDAGRQWDPMLARKAARIMRGK